MPCVGARRQNTLGDGVLRWIALFGEWSHVAPRSSTASGEAQMVATTLNPARASTGYFYVWMAAACVAVAFGGFAPTYWLQVPAGTFVGAPILHLHGLVFSAWTLLLLSQT